MRSTPLVMVRKDEVLVTARLFAAHAECRWNCLLTSGSTGNEERFGINALIVTPELRPEGAERAIRSISTFSCN